MARRFVFVGVTTSASSIVPIFPRWREALDLGDVELEGWDLPVGAPAARYREAVTRLQAEPDVVGALVTTHKLDLFHAAARPVRRARRARPAAPRGVLHRAPRRTPARLGEGCDQRRPGARGAHAARATSRAAATRSCSAPAGPAARSSTTCSAAAPPPGRVIVTDHSRSGSSASRRWRRGSPATAPSCVAALPPRSLVVNATGMGKDRPGSPLGPAARFPPRVGGVGAQLPRRARVPAPGARPAGGAGPPRRGRLAVLRGRAGRR